MSKEIDFTPLCDFLKSAINMLDIELSIVWPENAKRPAIVCPNLVEHCGPFKAAIKDAGLMIFSFGGFGGSDGSGYWMSIDIYYESHTGGTNGITIADAWYYEQTNKWIFKPVKQNATK